MGRSSRILGFACLFVASPVLAQGFHGRAIPMRFPVIVRPAMRPTIPVVRPGFAARPQRGLVVRGFGPGVRRFGNGLGPYGPGLGLSLAGDLAVPPAAYSEGPGPEFVPAYAPPARCIQPLIIAIGRGLRAKSPRTRVVYGQRPACVP